MILQKNILIGKIPAVIYGEQTDKIYLFVHGQYGNKEEARDFAKIVLETGWQVLSVDLPEHGERTSATERFYPWIVVPELQAVWCEMAAQWHTIGLRANSIGAWFSMLAFADKSIVKSLFVSPILDMERMIYNMMEGAGVTEARLKAAKTIPIDHAQTLSWKYLLYAKEHPLNEWDSDTRILYGSEDNLTKRTVVDRFVKRFHAELTVMEGGEHWFHTEKQLLVLNDWIKKNC